MPPPVNLLFTIWVALALAQGAEPLRKTALVQLLTGSALSKEEIAALIAQNCLSFTPTDRDRNDLRALGADSTLMGAIDGCVRKSTALRVALLQPRVAGVAGRTATIQVALRRGEQPAVGERVLLRRTRVTVGGPARDAESVTDDRGVATFRVPVGTRAGTYDLMVAAASGETLGGRGVVQLATLPGAPAVVELRPPRLDVRVREARPYEVTVAVTDQFRNPVPGQPVELRPGEADRGIAVLSRPTNAQGEASFTLVASSFRRPTVLRVLVRGRAMASLPVALVGAISESRTGFVSGGGQRDVVGARLSQPLIFRVRDSTGAPLPGLAVSVTATNARLAPEQDLTDSAGSVRIAVVLGEKAGPAVVTATVGSLKKQVSLYATAGPVVKLVVACSGMPFSGRLDIELDSLAVLRITARDRFGNEAPLIGLRAAVTDRQVLRVRKVAVDSLGGTVTLQPRTVGGTSVAIEGSGFRTELQTAVGPRGAPAAPACK